ncbi:hypothetical protein PCANC_02307 [Puccinia coronata f. sp. avenae]|uniref:Uncharacterized protein n=1 Tax=Puccinia coronata f. sp. avenae TaxID=200324 RepID=A0A2N5VZG0_9BASI|nr:hypothetical protein PCANC_02307 [Puccinia coronata f. sp. avenae]
METTSCGRPTATDDSCARVTRGPSGALTGLSSLLVGPSSLLAGSSSLLAGPSSGPPSSLWTGADSTDPVQRDRQPALESTSTVQQLASQAHNELHTLKPMCEGVHEEFIKYKDDYIDYYKSLLTTRPSTDKSPGTVLGDGGSKSSRLVDAMAEHMGWLQELGRLELWFTVLLGFRERNQALLQSAHQPAPHSSAATQELDALADQLFELVQSYQEFRALAHPSSGHRTHLHLYEYIHQILRQALHALIDIVSS